MSNISLSSQFKHRNELVFAKLDCSSSASLTWQPRKKICVAIPLMWTWVDSAVLPKSPLASFYIQPSWQYLYISPSPSALLITELYRAQERP